MSRLICIGNVGLEKTTVYNRTQRYIGGSGLHFSLGVLMSNTSCELWSIVENNKQIRRYLNSLKSHDLDIKHIEIQQNSLYFETKYDNHFHLKQFKYNKLTLFSEIESFLRRHIIRNTGSNTIIHIAPLGFQTELQALHYLAKYNDAIFSYQCHFSSLKDMTIEQFEEILSLVSFIFINKSELQRLSRKFQLTQKELVKKISTKIRNVIIVTDSEKTVFVYKKGEIIAQKKPFQGFDIVDPTGAGDSFSGAYLGSYSRGYTHSQCLHNACMISAFSITGWGTSSLYTYITH